MADPFVFDKGETSQAEGAPASTAALPVSGDREGLEGRIVSALRTVYDPEIPVEFTSWVLSIASTSTKPASTPPSA